MTQVEVNHAALLSDVTTSAEERTRWNKYSAMFAAVGSCTSFFAHAVWDGGSLARFRVFAVAVALLACAAFKFTVAQLEEEAAAAVGNGGDSHQDGVGGGPAPAASPTARKRLLANDAAGAGSPDRLPRAGAKAPATPKRKGHEGVTFARFARQMTRQRNFLVFVVFSCSQVFDCTFEKNFFCLFLETLGGDHLGAHTRSAVVAFSFVLPHVCTVLFMTPALARWGVYGAVGLLLRWRVALLLAGGLGAALLPRGAAAWVLACAFLLFNRVLSEAMCRLFPLVTSDLIDEDVYLNQRDRPGGRSMGATIIGSGALFSKPFQSVAPMFGYFLLGGGAADGAIGAGPAADGANGGGDGYRGLHAVLDEADEMGGTQGLNLDLDAVGGNGGGGGGGGLGSGTSRELVLWVLVLVPLAVVLLQQQLWRRYKLRGAYLGKVKDAVRELRRQHQMVV